MSLAVEIEKIFKIYPKKPASAIVLLGRKPQGAYVVFQALVRVHSAVKKSGRIFN